MGTTRWNVLVKVSLRAARSGILAGVCFALARVGGETAPLLVTARALAPVSADPMQSAVTLNVAALDLVGSSDPSSQHLAWASTVVLMVGVVATAVAGRLLARRSA
jgi:phosphate transport system permease protein